MPALPHFTDEALEGLLSIDDAVETMRAAFLEHGRGSAPVQLRTPTDAPGGFRLNTMAAAIPALGVAGAKVYTAFRSKFSFVILLFSMEDGRALASFDAGALTRLRTSAVSVLACEQLARPDSRVLAVFGAGVQARAHAEAFARRFALREIRVVARSGAEGFAAQIGAITGLPVRACDAAAALAGADLVVTATRSPTPLFDGRLLPEGCTVAAVGSSKPDTAELDATAVGRFASIVVESLPAARHEAGDLLLAARAGVDAWPRVVELGAVLGHGQSPRRSPTEIHCFQSLGLALEDVAIAAAAFARLRPATAA